MIREIQLRRVLDRVEGAEGDGVAVAAPEGSDVPEDRRRQGHPPPGFPRAGPLKYPLTRTKWRFWDTRERNGNFRE